MRNELHCRPHLLLLEDRLAPATASLATGTLTINYASTGTTAESVKVASDGTNITISGNVTGTTSTAVANVSKITVTASGNSTNQGLTIGDDTAGANTVALTLSGGLSTTGIETVTINRSVNVTSTGTMSITTNVAILVEASLSTASGDMTLKANQGATASSGKFDGIDIGDAPIGSAPILSSTSGNISLTGRGGTDAGGDQWGVYIAPSAIVGSGTTGTVSVTGRGPPMRAWATWESVLRLAPPLFRETIH
jgi:hypothetical protein